MTKTYKAKISYGLLVAIFLLFFVPAIFGVINNGINKGFYVLMVILISSYAFILQMFLKTVYKIENSQLEISCGFLYHKKIDISEIKSVKKTNSILSSPAPSFDRIAIAFGKFDEVLISPEDKVAFVKDLIKINPEITNNITET
jgi:hypothetical protein